MPNLTNLTNADILNSMDKKNVPNSDTNIVNLTEW